MVGNRATLCGDPNWAAWLAWADAAGAVVPTPAALLAAADVAAGTSGGGSEELDDDALRAEQAWEVGRNA